jgi:hypothetical protein
MVTQHRETKMRGQKGSYKRRHFKSTREAAHTAAAAKQARLMGAHAMLA